MPDNPGVPDMGDSQFPFEVGECVIVDATDTKPFPYPQFSYTDKDGLTWLTDNEGKNLYAWKDNKHISDYDP